MYPVAGGTVRMPTKDVLLGGRYLIPKHVTVFVPVSHLHCSRTLSICWHNCLSFEIVLFRS